MWKRNLVVHKGCIAPPQVTAEQDDVGAGLSLEVSFGDDDDIHWLCKLLVEQLHLVQAGLDVPLHSRLLKVLPREVVGGHLVAILAMRTPPA